MNKIAIYVRCSTNKQDLDLQLHDLQGYCSQRGLEVYRVYQDFAQSGAKEDRPALKEMMDDVRKRKVNAVLVWKFDRFARSLSHLVTALHEFESLGVDFISYTENIDTTNPTGKLVFSLIGAIAEFERSLIRSRVKAGIENAKKQGKQLGRPRVGFDFKKAFHLKSEGMSLRKIARECNVSLGTITRTLQAV